ncbi:ABC transporter permease [Pseudonocardia asaccharolytica]|uniref:ABC transporter permease n=1 Tax=Pseudonocardia asaccharolytica DSM 44247 = NBRC 16224 TaxID=1123024 RepID=A0A511D0H8_9PSEU|nr:ABC transporter permease [Pseudonocardia asaccharolytica]GEL18305.1 ABC transporter permease [Pseudonocardia asaccharolytica DSM 44247 = NBRC 16224]
MSTLAVERIKLTSTRSPWWCTGLALTAVVGIAALYAGLADGDVPMDVSSTQIGNALGMMIMMVMAALAVTTEYRFGTIRATFLAVPSRTRALVAKTTVVAVVTGLVGLAAAFLSWGTGALIRPSVDLGLRTAADWRMVAGAGLTYLFAAIFALGIGILVRQSAAAVSILLVWPLLLEQLVQLIPNVGRDIQDWLPFTAANRFLTMTESVPEIPYGPWGALAYFAAVSLAVLVVGLLVAQRRDA